MACDLTLGRKEPCKDAIGGIDAIYFANFGTLTIANDATDAYLIEDLGSSVDLYKYDLKADANNLTQTGTSSRDNGTTFYDQVLTAVLKKIDAQSSNELRIMAYGRPHVVVHFRTGEAVLCGELRGMELNTQEITSGGAMGDLNGYTLTLQGLENTEARSLKGATVADPFAGLTNAPTVTEGTNT